MKFRCYVTDIRCTRAMFDVWDELDLTVIPAPGPGPFFVDTGIPITISYRGLEVASLMNSVEIRRDRVYVLDLITKSLVEEE